MILERELLTDALLDLLRENMPISVGDSEPPKLQNGEYELPPFAIVYSIPGGEFSGPGWSDPEADADVIYQVSAVGVTRRQAEWVADHARRIVVGRTLGSFDFQMTPPPGWKVTDRRHAFTPGGTPREDVLFNTVDSYILAVTPA